MAYSRRNIFSHKYAKELWFFFSLKDLCLENTTVPNGKGQGQPACQKEWKKCEEENE
jgi:hypothetical protein